MVYNYEFNLKLHDKIKIGHDIIISVSRLGTKNTDFACDAPRHISFVRQELIETEEIVVEEIILKQ